MFEKVNPAHPDKIADRIAGAIVDLAYAKEDNPKCAVEVLIGHGKCRIVVETSVRTFTKAEIENIVNRIAGYGIEVNFDCVAQDPHLAGNQNGKFRCGDNGIFCGMPVTDEQSRLSELVRAVYRDIPRDGKYIINNNEIIACQSHIDAAADYEFAEEIRRAISDQNVFVRVNPIGEWTGGTNVDTGATNRKLGSDMGDAVTGGGLHGKDLSKADVSVNIYAHIRAQQTGQPVKLFCAIGDEYVDGIPYNAIVEIAKDYIHQNGGFEKFAEWGLI